MKIIPGPIKKWLLIRQYRRNRREIQDRLHVRWAQDLNKDHPINKKRVL